MSDFDGLMRLDAQLSAAGIPPLTEFWRGTLARWYGHQTAKTLVARVGRAGVKSHTATKVALAETLFGDWQVPIGERHYFAIVSVSKSEAAQRLRLLEAMLRALGVGFDRSGDEISLVTLPLGFKVFACNVGAVSGFRCIGYICDELAKWTSDDAAADPAIEVIASLQAMCATHAAARKLLVSSPLSTVNEHCRRFEMGDTDDQLVVFAPTWEANPSISEEQTHRLEPDLRVWSREYAAMPQSAICAVFEPADIERSIHAQPSGTWSRPIVTIDPSGFGRDAFVAGAWAWCAPEQILPPNCTCEVSEEWTGPHSKVVTKEYRQWHIGGKYDVIEPPKNPSQLCLFRVQEFNPRNTEFGELVKQLAAFTHSVGAHIIFSDQYLDYALHGPLSKLGLRFEAERWTNTNKSDAALRVRTLMRGGQLCLPANTTLKDQLTLYSAKAQRSGTIRLEGKGSTHDDYVSLLLGVCIAETFGLVNGSPSHLASYRHEVPR